MIDLTRDQFLTVVRRGLVPQAVEDVSVREDAQHDVLRGGVVDERALGVDKEHVGHPDLLDQAPVKRHALVGAAGERQALVLPVVTQVQRHGEVLGRQQHSTPCLIVWPV